MSSDCASNIKIQDAIASALSSDQGSQPEPTNVGPTSSVAIGNAEPLIVSALEAAMEVDESTWVLRPYIPADSLALFYGDYGSMKTFVGLDWALRVSLGLPAVGFNFTQEPQPVVYIMAEGKRGLSKRLKAWCQKNCPDEPWASVLKRAKVDFIRRPMNLSNKTELEYLVRKIEERHCHPALIVVDTLSRNSDGEPERSSDTASKYLNGLDNYLRVRFGCSVLLVHHVGHAEKGRHRGPIVLAANTDVEIRVERRDKDELDISLHVLRVKDHETPEPAGLRAVVIDLNELDRDGERVTSLAMEALPAVPGCMKAVRLGGKNQKTLWKGIQTWRAMRGGESSISFADLTAVAKEVDLTKHSARTSAIDGLVKHRALNPIADGYQISD
jgi:hypothetical protein